MCGGRGRFDRGLWRLRRYGLNKLWRLGWYVVDLRRVGQRLDYADPDRHRCCHTQQRFGRDRDQRKLILEEHDELSCAHSLD
jgi:hypothetical protein